MTDAADLSGPILSPPIARREAGLAVLAVRALESDEVDELHDEAATVLLDTLGAEVAEVLRLEDDPPRATLAHRAVAAGGLGARHGENARDSAIAVPVARFEQALEAPGLPVHVAGEHGYGDVLLAAFTVAGKPVGMVIARAMPGTHFGQGERAHLGRVVALLSAGAVRGRREERLRRMALEDAVTGLPNRAVFIDRVAVAVARTRRRPLAVAVLYVDLDGFKQVNDVFGHDAGDEVLAAAAQRMRMAVRPADTVARIGGDEFAVLCEDLTAPEEAEGVAERLREALSRPYRLPDGTVTVTASVGVAVDQGEGADGDALLRAADAAMYQVKRTRKPAVLGPPLVIAIDEPLQAVVPERQDDQIGTALDRGQLELHYLPEVDLGHGVVRVEALLRWRHPIDGLKSPAAFLADAEASGAIHEIGRWVLSEACGQAREWFEDGADGPLAVTVNVSRMQLEDPRFIDAVFETLTRQGLSPDRLVLDVPADAVRSDAGNVIEVLERIRSGGVGVALDGIGGSELSLAQLRELPLDVVKIDRINRAGNGENDDLAVVAAFVDLAHRFGLIAVAEGVETSGQLGALRRVGFDIAQGYYWTRPLPPKDLAAWVLGHSH